MSTDKMPKPALLRRYSLYGSLDGGGPAEEEPDPDGRWVLYDDVSAALAAQAEKHAAELSQAPVVWRVKYENDCYPDGEGGSTLVQWWTVTDGTRVFRAEFEDDAQLLAEALNARGSTTCTKT